MLIGEEKVKILREIIAITSQKFKTKVRSFFRMFFKNT
ncbi:hypothetical protein NT05HA_0929 [Aggregatibacter aphrophilus NJ8700]|nr:hypothetical protein NT05HA_0929 [Aggregatibacter aphrophilus NJ8700]